MTKKYLPDIVSICAILLIVILVAVWQNATVNTSPQATKQVTAKPTVSVAKPEPKSIFNLTVADDALRKRNIFAETGSYLVTKKTPGAKAGESFTLLGILSGKERKAVLRDGQGAVNFCSVGKKLGEFVVARIDSTSVVLKSKTETRELKIFNVQYKPPKR